jgi:hypothetical protein
LASKTMKMLRYHQVGHGMDSLRLLRSRRSQSLLFFHCGSTRYISKAIWRLQHRLPATVPPHSYLGPAPGVRSHTFSLDRLLLQLSPASTMMPPLCLPRSGVRLRCRCQLWHKRGQSLSLGSCRASGDCLARHWML